MTAEVYQLQRTAIPLKTVKTAHSTIRLLVADHDTTFREELRRVLELESRITIVGETQNGADCRTLLNKLKPDILLVDVRTPGKNGLSALDGLDWDTLSTRVLVLTSAEDDRYIIRAMRFGARGALSKQCSAELLVRSIECVNAGEIWLGNRMTAEILKAFSKSSDKRQADIRMITGREKKIVEYIAQGLRNKEIGEKMFITEQTVKNHLHNIFDKLGVSDRLELTLHIIHHTAHGDWTMPAIA